MKISVGILLLSHAFALAQSNIPNVPQVPGRLLAGMIEPMQGRTAVLEIHEGYLWSAPESPGSLPGSDLRIRAWDISGITGDTPETRAINVQLKQTLSVSNGPLDSHGSLKSDQHLHLGSFNRSYRLDLETGDFVEDNRPPWLLAHSRAHAFSPWGMTKFDTYTPPFGLAEFQKEGVTIATWDHIALTGVIGHSFVIGNIMYVASEGSRTGVAAYDMASVMDESLPAEMRTPVLLDILTDGAPGGYQPEMWAGDGKLYVVFPYRTAGNGVRVADVTDPSDMKFIADFPIQSTDESMYAQFQDHFAFISGSKIDMRNFSEVLTLDLANTQRLDDPTLTGFSASQYALPAGNLVITGGYGDRQGAAIWAHQAEPDTTPPTVAYHTPKANQSGYPRYAPITLMIHETLEIRTIRNGETFMVRPILADDSLGNAITGNLAFSYNDFLTFTPHAPLAENTTYEVSLTAGGIQDVVGNGMTAYSFRFSTGAAVNTDNHLPAIDSVAVTTSPSTPGETISFSVSASDSDVGDTLEYRFDPGDGSDRTAWQASGEFSHVYSQQEHYNVIFQVRDGGQVFTSSSRKITIAPAAAATLPTSSAQLVVVPAAGAIPSALWCVNPDNDTITRVNATTHEILQEIQTGKDPRSVALASDGTIWVACHDSDELHLYLTDGTHFQTITLPYGSAPIALCPTPDALTILCTLSGSGRLLKYDAVTRSETGNIQLGPTARAIAITADGQRALVTRFISPEHHGEVWDVAVDAFTLTRTIPLLKNRGGRLTQDNTGGSRGVPNYLAGITLSPDNSRAWVASNQDNTDRGLLTGSYPADLTHDSTVRAVISQIDLNTNREVIDNTINQFDLTTVGRIDVDNASIPKAIAFSPLGDYMFVAMEGNNAVMVYDSLSFENASSGVVVARIAVGLAPQSLIVDSISNTLWVKNFTGRSVSALNLADLISIGSVQLSHTEIKTVAEEKLSAQVLLGKRVFYNADDRRMSAEAYISCASCHADGGHDGRNWDFTGRGEGMRNTIPLNGRGGTAHGRMHWTANFDEVQDFENDIRNGFGGTGFLTEALWADPDRQSPLGSLPKSGHSAELDALAAYLSSLSSDSTPRSSHRNADGTMTAAAVAGQTHFTALNCTSCHVPESGYRDGIPHNVGTFLPVSGMGMSAPLTGIDTPTLLDISHTAPYFHHGVAETLEDVFHIAGGTTYEAESLIPLGGGVTLRPAVGGQRLSILINYDNTSYSGFAQITGNGSGLQMVDVDGGTGGSSGLLIRAYSTRTQPHTFTIVANIGTANESTASGILGPTISSTGYRHLWIEGLELIAGENNTINITANAGWPNLHIDQITVSNVDDLASASAHRTVQTLDASDRAELMAYILQLGAPSPSVSAIETWRATHFPTEMENESVSGDGADPDADGVNNGIEYFMGTDPRVASTTQRPQFAPHQEDGQDYLRYTFQRDLSAMGNVFSIQKSYDLFDWFLPNNIIQRELSRTGDIQQLELLVPNEADEASQFIRLYIDR